jgi:hypothetical protein
VSLALGAQLSGVKEAAAGLELTARRAADLTPVLQQFGKHMKTVSVPKNFAAKGRPDRWPDTQRFGQIASDPLYDQGNLLRNVDYSVDGQDLVLGEKLKQGHFLQEGGTITGHPWLAIPQFPALSKSEIRNGPGRIEGGFFLEHGPEGRGIYRAGRGQQRSTVFRGARGQRLKRARAVYDAIQKVIALVPSVKGRPHPFVLFQQEDISLFLALVARHLRLQGPSS